MDWSFSRARDRWERTAARVGYEYLLLLKHQAAKSDDDLTDSPDAEIKSPILERWMN